MASKERIASLLAGATEIVYALGLGDRLVAISHECDYPPEATTKPRVTLSRIYAQATSQAIDDQVRTMTSGGAPLYEIDVAQLASLRPDLIITQAQCDVCAVRCEDVVAMVRGNGAFAGTQLVALNPNSLADLLGGILRVGEAAGSLPVAERYVAGMQNRLAAVQERTRALAATARPRVACIEWTEPLMLAGNWVPEMIELAGARHDLTTAGTHSPYAAWEDVRRYNPEVIVIAPCGFDLNRATAEAAGLTSRPGWFDIAAVRAGRVYAMDGNAYLNRSGPRIVDTLEILAHLFHPQLFGPPLEPSAWRQL